MNKNLAEYIHYKYKNYEQFGLNTNSNGTKATYGEMKNSLINRYVSLTKTSINIVQLENELNDLLVKVGSQATQIEAQTDVDIFNFTKDFIDEVQQKYPDIQFDSNLKVISKYGKVDKLTQHSAKKYVNFSALKNNINKLQQWKEQIDELPVDINNQLKRIDVLYTKLKQEIGADMMTLKNGNSTAFEKLRNNTEKLLYSIIRGDEKYPPLNDLMAAVESLARVQAAQGYSTEIFIKHALSCSEDFAKKQGYTELNKFINSLRTGGKRSIQAISGDLLNAKSLSTSHTATEVNGKILYKRNVRGEGQQMKVDVSAEYLGEDTGFNIKSKNPYVPDKGKTINIHSGISLLQLLQEEGEFFKHYLNIVPTRRGSNSRDAQNPNKQEINQWHSLMKIAVVARSLMGSAVRLDINDNFDPISQIFIVHNNTNGRIKVFNIGMLIEQLSQDIENTSSIKFSKDPKTISNRWVKKTSDGKDGHAAARARIYTMLSEFDRVKFEASLKTTSII